MKNFFWLVAVLILNCNIVYAESNFQNFSWWQTVTVEDVKKELANGADVNAKDNLKRTPLTIAAEYCSPDIIKELLEAGAEVNAEALRLAAWQNSPDAVKILIDASVNRNVNVNEKGFGDNTALMFAASNRRQSPKPIKMLLDAGADVNAKNERGETALIIAAERSSLDVVQVLVEAGADVNAKDYKGETVLMHAIYNSSKIVKFLIDSGADLNAKNIYGKTVYYKANRRENGKSASLQVLTLLEEIGNKDSYTKKVMEKEKKESAQDNKKSGFSRLDCIMTFGIACPHW